MASEQPDPFSHANVAPGTARRVLYVIGSISAHHGGPVHNCAALVRALVGGGFQVTVMTPAAAPADRAWFEALAGCDAIVEMPRSRLQRVFPLAAILWLSRHARTYDVIHVSGLLNPFTSIVARVATAMGRTVVVTLNGAMARAAIRHRSATLKRVWIALLDRPTLRAASGIHLDTDREAREAAVVLTMPLDRFTVIPPVVDLPRRSPHDRVGSVGTVLALSRLHPIKGIEVLIDAWPAIAAARPDSRLVIAGDGDPDYVASLHRRARDRGVSVEFAGWVDGDAKAELFGRSVLFVLPSLYESFGRTLAEALSFGLPCITSSSVNMAPWLVEHGVGKTFDGTAVDLAHVVTLALQDAAFRQSVAMAGPRLVDASFGPDRAIRAFATFYDGAA